MLNPPPPGEVDTPWLWVWTIYWNCIWQTKCTRSFWQIKRNTSFWQIKCNTGI